MAKADTRKVAVRAGLASIAAAGLVAVGAAAPANAQIVSFCSGVAGDVTVPGDLIIRADDWCMLEGTTVNGDVTVRAGADLVTTDGELNGRVVVRSDSYLDITNTVVTGRVILRDAYGLLAVDSDLGEHLVTRQVEQDAPSGAVLTIGSSVAGNINAQVGAVWLGDSTMAGAVVGNGADYVDLDNSVVDRQLRVSNALDGSVICDSEVYGPVTYTDNQGPVQFGGDTLTAGCESANYWHNNVSIDNTAGDLHITENIIRRDLTGEGNDPAPAGEGNRVRGATGGQFDDIAPADGGPSLSAQQSRELESDRGEQLRYRLEDRRDSAVQQANALGAANL